MLNSLNFLLEREETDLCRCMELVLPHRYNPRKPPARRGARGPSSGLYRSQQREPVKCHKLRMNLWYPLFTPIPISTSSI